MARAYPNSADLQLPLALDPPDGPQSESALRIQYRRMQISHRMTFAQAMSDIAIAICIRNLAEAATRRQPTQPLH